MSEDLLIDLLRTSKSLDSLKPLDALNDLVSKLSESFLKAFASTAMSTGFNPYDKAFITLKKEGWEKEVTRVKSFLEIYGDRSFEELKIESLPLKNNPILFQQLLKWGKTTTNFKGHQKKSETTINLNFFETKILNFTRQCIALRESTRLWRGRFYHILRDQILRMIQSLMEEDARWKEFELLDFFSISHHEWLLFHQKKLSFEEVRGLIQKRKSWQTRVKNYPETVVWVQDEELPSFKNLANTTDKVHGQGVSQGIVEGVALVLEKPEDAFDTQIKDFILVTKNTDPAWVYIMSRSKGLISEKGSMLSHTAIIGRELGIPTIVGVKSATHRIISGATIRINGTTGEIDIL